MNETHARRVELLQSEREHLRSLANSETDNHLAEFANLLAHKLGVGGPNPKVKSVSHTRVFENPGNGSEARIVRVITCAAYDDGSCGCTSENLDGTGGFSFVPGSCP